MPIALGLSEPGNGSDLAGVTTRAVRDGDDYVINGQKMWTSTAHHSTWIRMLVRTDTDAPKHRGLSIFFVPLDSPGITIRPLHDMAGRRRWSEEFFEDVRVPSRYMMGEENRGWYVMAASLTAERVEVGSRQPRCCASGSDSSTLPERTASMAGHHSMIRSIALC